MESEEDGDERIREMLLGAWSQGAGGLSNAVTRAEVATRITSAFTTLADAGSLGTATFQTMNGIELGSNKKKAGYKNVLKLAALMARVERYHQEGTTEPAAVTAMHRKITTQHMKSTNDRQMELSAQTAPRPSL